METDTNTVRIRELNDGLRAISLAELSFRHGISTLPETEQATILDRVRAFDDFSEDNDPWHEHDFGSFDHDGRTINLEDRLLRSRPALPLA